MADPEHVAILTTGIAEWNGWRQESGVVHPDLRGLDLNQQNLQGVDFSGVDLYRASMWKANLADANLESADLSSATMNGTILTRANLRHANLRFARLVGAEVTDSIFSECHIYGCSVWNLRGRPKAQVNVVITPPSESAITVDDIEIGQFIFLMLNNERIRHVIDTITSKIVLILGRFTPERKVILDAIRDELRNRDYTPVLFDFEKPESRTTVETVSTLAHMARFVIADLTEAKSVLQELMAIAPHNPSVPIQPLLLTSESEPGMFDFFRLYPWVLPVCEYNDQEGLLAALNEKVIAPAEAMARIQTGK